MLVYTTADRKGEVCVSILVSFRILDDPSIAELTIQHQPGEDEWGYEDAGERWLPVHTVESVVSWQRRLVERPS